MCAEVDPKEAARLETVAVMHELVDACRQLEAEAKIGKKAPRAQAKIPEIPSDEREYVGGELAGIARYIVKTCGLTIPETRRLLHELLDVSV